MKWQKSLRSRRHAWLMLAGSPCAKSTGGKGGKVHFYQRLEHDRGLLMNCYFGAESALCYFKISSCAGFSWNRINVLHGSQYGLWFGFVLKRLLTREMI